MKLKGLLITLFALYALSSGSPCNQNQEINITPQNGRFYWPQKKETWYYLSVAGKTHKTKIETMEELFKDAQENNVFADVLPLRKDLAHVVSWADIRDVVDEWAKKKKTKNHFDLKLFIQYVTEVDREAVLWDTNGKFVSHEAILGYNNNILKDINTGIRKCLEEELKQASPNTMLIKKLLYIAPANLRYGFKTANNNIKEYHDPMGNQNKMLTSKEKSLILATDDDIKFWKVTFKTQFGKNPNPNFAKNTALGNYVFSNLNNVSKFGQFTLFNSYVKYFQDVIMKHFNKDSLVGTNYDIGKEKTQKNLDFDPRQKGYAEYVKSSSQQSILALGTDGIRYYIKYE